MPHSTCLFCEKIFEINSGRGQVKRFCSIKCRDINRIKKSISIQDIDQLKEKKLKDIETGRESIGLDMPKHVSLKPKNIPQEKAKAPNKEMKKSAPICKAKLCSNKTLHSIAYAATWFSVGALWAFCLTNSDGFIQSVLSVPFLAFALIADVSRVPAIWISILAIVITRMITKRLVKKNS